MGQSILAIITVPVQTYGASLIDSAQNEIASGQFAGGLTVHTSDVEHDAATRHYSDNNLTGKFNCVKSPNNALTDCAILVINATQGRTPVTREKLMLAHQTRFLYNHRLRQNM